MPYFRYLAVFSIFAILLTLMPISSSACSCAQPNSVQEELERADAVFLGKVLDSYDANKNSDIYSTDDQIQYLFQVDEIWKGLEQSQVIVNSVRDSVSCGSKFVEDVEYVVFASQEEHSLSTNFCTMTKHLSKATNIIDELGLGEKPSEEVTIPLSEETVQSENTVQVESKTFIRYLYIPIVLSLVFIGFLILQKKRSRK